MESYETVELHEELERDDDHIPSTHDLSSTTRVSPPPPPPPPLMKPVPAKLRKSDPSSRRKADADPAAPRKPQNAFLRFFQDHKDAYASQTEGEGLAKHHEVTKALAKVWGEAKPELKKVRSY